jgi:hypothetical protein
MSPGSTSRDAFVNSHKNQSMREFMESQQIDGELPENIARRSRHGRRVRRSFWFLAVIFIIATGLFIASFFLDGIVRARIEARMNSSLKGYRVTLAHAHLQLLGLRMTLRRLEVVQEAHPNPPVAEFPLVRFQIYWRELLWAHVVANVGFLNPGVHIDRTQFDAQRHSKTPLRDRGWQQALQDAYPFKINRLAIMNGNVTYVNSPNGKPLTIRSLDFVSDNIRNIHEPNHVYPSRFWATMVVFEKGRLKLEGRANYLMQPFPGMVTNYAISGAPLSAVSPASRNINLIVKGGILSSEGSVEYSPKITDVDVHDAIIDGVDVTYVHKPGSEVVENQRITKAGRTIEKENNRPAVDIKLHEVEIRHSRLAFNDETAEPVYVLFLDNAEITVTNLSNHRAEGLSHVDLTGGFMGSGKTHVYGTFLAAGSGPEFTTNLEILNTDLTALNPFLRAHGRFDVAQGRFTLYSHLGLKDDQISGYVKPMFTDVKVYDYRKDKNKNLLQQAKELVIGAAAHVFKNRNTQQVATQVDLKGTLKDPNVSTWQAFVEAIRNAFIQAILPGFDRQTRTDGARTTLR